MRFLCIGVFLCFTLIVKAQFLDTIKSITNKKPSIGVRLESRYSFLRNGLVKVGGVRLGVVFQKKLKRLDLLNKQKPKKNIRVSIVVIEKSIKKLKFLGSANQTRRSYWSYWHNFTVRSLNLYSPLLLSYFNNNS